MHRAEKKRKQWTLLINVLSIKRVMLWYLSNLAGTATINWTCWWWCCVNRRNYNSNRYVIRVKWYRLGVQINLDHGDALEQPLNNFRKRRQSRRHDLLCCIPGKAIKRRPWGSTGSSATQLRVLNSPQSVTTPTVQAFPCHVATPGQKLSEIGYDFVDGDSGVENVTCRHRKLITARNWEGMGSCTRGE